MKHRPLASLHPLTRDEVDRVWPPSHRQYYLDQLRNFRDANRPDFEAQQKLAAEYAETLRTPEDLADYNAALNHTDRSCIKFRSYERLCEDVKNRWELE